jgi:hypothetical protein
MELHITLPILKWVPTMLKSENVGDSCDEVHVDGEAGAEVFAEAGVEDFAEADVAADAEADAEAFRDPRPRKGHGFRPVAFGLALGEL